MSKKKVYQKLSENQANQISKLGQIIKEQIPCLSNTQAKVLGMITYAMTLCRSCGLTTVSAALSIIYGKKENSFKQRIREWYYDSKDKKGENRSEINVETCFAFLMRWILTLWKSTSLFFAIDATYLSSRFTILSISIVYRGFAIPVAWKIMIGNQPGSWIQEWTHLLDLIKPCVPRHLFVMVAADRGLYSPYLFQYVKKLKWHPLFRIQSQGFFRPRGANQFYPLRHFIHEHRPCCVSGTAFKNFDGRIQKCVLLAWQAENAKEAWFILTDFFPSDACFYSLRFCIEQGFRTTKRGFWEWHNTKMFDPKRASRVWLAISVATIYLASIGTPLDDAYEKNSFPYDKKTWLPQQKPKRRLSIVRRAWINFIIYSYNNILSYLANLIPEPLPCVSKEFLENVPKFLLEK